MDAPSRRSRAGMRGADFKHSDDETLWSMSPCVRKPWAKKRSRPPHHVPLAGWAAAAQRRIYAVSEGEWLLPVRPRNLDVAPKQPHANPNWITKLVERLPGMDMNPHRIRDARASYGPERLGWAKNDTNTVLDHLERFRPGRRHGAALQHVADAGAEARDDAAVAGVPRRLRGRGPRRRPALADVTRIRDGIYRKRYGELGWRRAIKRAKDARDEDAA